MVCKGICTRHHVKKDRYGKRYAEGHKRCQICEIWIKWDASLFCPCCSYRLRTKSRHKGSLIKYQQRKLLQTRIQ